MIRTHMKAKSLLTCAAFGALLSTYVAALSAIAIIQGVYTQDWSRQEFSIDAGDTPTPQLVVLFEAIRKSNHVATVAFTSVSQMAESQSVRSLVASSICAVFFVVLFVSIWRHRKGL